MKGRVHFHVQNTYPRVSHEEGLTSVSVIKYPLLIPNKWFHPDSSGLYERAYHRLADYIPVLSSWGICSETSRIIPTTVREGVLFFVRSKVGCRA